MIHIRQLSVASLLIVTAMQFHGMDTSGTEQGLNVLVSAALAAIEKESETKPASMFTCESCLKEYKALRGLKRHIAIKHSQLQPSSFTKKHTKKGTFACNWPGCNQSFTEDSSRVRHRNAVHLKKRGYICPITDCARSFSRQEHLNLHLASKTHNHSKKYTFKSKSKSHKS